MSLPPKVSVVVLAFNSAAYLPVCLAELRKARGVELEVLVVDNASADGSADVAEATGHADRVIRLERNLGCAGGNNVGWRAAKHPVVLFLNPDCVLAPGAIALMAAPLLADPAIGATGCRLRYPNSRTLQHAGGILHPNAMAEHVGMGEEDRGQFDADRDVPYVTGAAMAARRADLEVLGGMDEEFFPAYYEETDLCTRLLRSGLRVVCVGAALGWHHESVGLAKGSSRFVETSYRRRIIYVVKNYSVGEWLGRFWPFELRWVLGPHARGFRGPWARSLAWGAVFAGKCVLRFNRRPGGVRARLPGAK